MLGMDAGSGRRIIDGRYVGRIADDFKAGKGLRVGCDVIIEPNVVVGENVKLGHRCTLKSGTRIGNNSVVDDHCITTGACWIGDNVNVRTGATISKATIVEDWAFIGPGVITNHTKHVSHGRPKVRSSPLITYIGLGSILGSQASILAGVFIGANVIIGGGAVTTRDIYESGIYVGNPIRRIGDIGQYYEILGRPRALISIREIVTELAKSIPGLNIVDIEQQSRAFQYALDCVDGGKHG